MQTSFANAVLELSPHLQTSSVRNRDTNVYIHLRGVKTAEWIKVYVLSAGPYIDVHLHSSRPPGATVSSCL